MKVDRFEEKRIYEVTPLDRLRAEYARTPRWRWLKRQHLKQDIGNVVDAVFMAESLF